MYITLNFGKVSGGGIYQQWGPALGSQRTSYLYWDTHVALQVDI